MEQSDSQADTRRQRAVGSRATKAKAAVALALWGKGGIHIRTRIYVDGFNLYYGAVKGTPFKWLNLQLLVAEVLPATCVVEKIKYFTARVSGAADPGAPARQQSYLNALGTIPQIEIHQGSFLSKNIWRPITNLPVANFAISTPAPLTLPPGNHRVNGVTNQTLCVGNYPPRGAPRRRGATRPLLDAVVAEVHTMEEKGSDVNLASHLIFDGCAGDFDVAAVISNDTDLVTPIDMVVSKIKKPVYVICPGKWQASPALVRVGSFVRHIRRQMLAKSQFPDTIPGTTITKPVGW